MLCASTNFNTVSWNQYTWRHHSRCQVIITVDQAEHISLESLSQRLRFYALTSSVQYQHSQTSAERLLQGSVHGDLNKVREAIKTVIGVID